MRTFLRRLRGIAGIGLTWSAAWGGAGAVLGVVQWLIMSRGDPDMRVPMIGLAIGGGLVLGSYGLVTGTLFGAILAIADRSRKLEQLSKWRIAAWGCIAGAVVLFMNIVAVRIFEGTVLQNGPIAVLLSAGLGAVSAAATLHLARSAAPHSADAPDVLGDAEAWKLPAAEFEISQKRVHHAGRRVDDRD